MANSRIYDILAVAFLVLAFVALFTFAYIGLSTPAPATPMPIIPTVAVLAQLPTNTQVAPVGPPTLPPTFLRLKHRPIEFIKKKKYFFFLNFFIYFISELYKKI